MQFRESAKFVFLVLGAFFLSLGTALLLFSMVEVAFFALHGLGYIVFLSVINVVLGALLLLLRGRKSI